MTLRQATRMVRAYAVLQRPGDGDVGVCWDEEDRLWACRWGRQGFELVLQGPNLSRADLRANDWMVVGHITTLGG